MAIGDKCAIGLSRRYAGRPARPPAYSPSKMGEMKTSSFFISMAESHGGSQDVVEGPRDSAENAHP
jgi:hypothetical protein